MSSVSSHKGFLPAGDGGRAPLCPGADEAQEREPLALGPVRIGLMAGLGLLLLVGTGWLWARHGGTVFFDMLTAGLGTCL